MSKQSSQKKNPLNMYELYEGGPFVLLQPCAHSVGLNSFDVLMK